MNRQEVKTFLQTKTGIYMRSSYTVIEVRGKEHREWIHRITSQASLHAMPGEVITTAFLSGSAGVLSYFLLLILKDKVWILAEPQATQKILSYLDFSHFGEDVSFSQINPTNYFEILGTYKGTIQAEYILPAAAWNIGGKIIINASALPDLPLIELDTYRLLQRAQGWPIDQIDIHEENILLEAEVLSSYATDTKGCYPGQEVIAKIITYGRVAKKYVTLWTTERPSTEEISYKDGKAGRVVAMHKLADGYLVFAYILRVAYEQFQKNISPLEVNGQRLQEF